MDGKAEWIASHQTFQRLAGLEEITSSAELGRDWNKMTKPQRERSLNQIRTQRAVQDAAIRAGKARNS